MGKHRRLRVRVYGKQRKDIDPHLLTQVIVMYVRMLQQQQATGKHRARPTRRTRKPKPSATEPED
ncbi:hypothetical protein M8C13_25725 [Crossiella sp. SN42]|uniref:hypothetical protein n=1 Tax=Crossiella sp. SN42 TaxID=2944808 RepID=UPI00207C35BC|nr:hypothetical protein [Crossiella sp. SN42]MCO1579154.1 hypothetical protein [Crossiella sp. SN42]